MSPEQLLTCALDIGENMLISGAEIGRVEDSIRLICRTYGCQRTNVFTITSSIVVSIEDTNRNYYTQTRRITGTQTDLSRLDKLNTLSRDICRNRPDYDYIQSRLAQILSAQRYPLWLEVVCSAMIGSAFAVFFGGNLPDAAVAALLGGLLRLTVFGLGKLGTNQILMNLISAFCLSLTAILLVRLGFGNDANKIILGNIMLLIPGIALTNSLRDMISGDIISGLLRFFDAILVAAAIAVGYIFAAQLLGGYLWI